MLLYGYTITAIFIGVVVLGTATGGRLSRILFANSSMLFVGIISYSLYLWHYPIPILQHTSCSIIFQSVAIDSGG